MDVSDDLRAVRDFIQALLKSKKTVRMYPDNNPIYRKTLDDTFSKVSDILDYREDLSFKIKQNEIFLDSEQVYHNPEKDDNLALFFFKDGLRELSFTKGLSIQELEEFLKIITLDFDREAVDDDIVTLLWEKDFHHIKYVADEAFLAEDEDYESKAVQEVKSKAATTDDVLKAYADAFDSEDVKEISIVNLSDKDLQFLVKEMEKDGLDKTVNMFEILFEMLFYAETAAEYEEGQRFLKELYSYCYRKGDFGLVVEILRRTREITEIASMPDHVKKQMKLLLASVNAPESIKSVGEIFSSDTELDDALLQEYIQFLDKTALQPFMSLLGELENIRGRKTVITILTDLGKRDVLNIHTIAKGLQDHRWYVVRNIIYILRHIGDKKAVEYLLGSAKHPDERVKKEAIKALGELKSPLGLQTLKDSLSDPDTSIRRLAARSLGAIGSEVSKRIVLEAISSKDFDTREFEEKKDFYEVLASWRDPDVIEYATNKLKKKAWFRRSQANENKACAAYYLGLIGHRDSLPLLQSLKGSSHRLLQEHAAAAIKKIEYGR